MTDESKTIDNAVDFLEKIKDEEEVNIRFTKKDGTLRDMRCTLSFDKTEYVETRNLRFKIKRR